jgi:hypothetical protein
MSVKIENHSKTKTPKWTESRLQKLLATLPREHLIGLERIRLVDSVTDPRLRPGSVSELPGLYHPRQGTQKAWIEIAVGVLLPQGKSFFKRLLPRMSFKANLAALLFSLVGQHYHLTLRHSVKKGQLESAVRAYTEKQLKSWSAQEHTFRSRIFKPLQPTMERWAKALQKRAAAEKRKAV